MTLTITLEVPNEIKIALIEAISTYLNYRRIQVNAIATILHSNQLTAENLLEVKQAIRTVKNISSYRKEDIENLLDIIYDINTTTGTLYTNILKYLEKMKTGWWFFNTGNSELKKQFHHVIRQYDAFEWDNKMIRRLNDKIQSLDDNVNLNRERVREISYVQASLNQYRLTKNRIISSTELDFDDGSGDELLNFLGTSCTSYRSDNSYVETTPTHALNNTL